MWKPSVGFSLDSPAFSGFRPLRLEQRAGWGLVPVCISSLTPDTRPCSPAHCKMLSRVPYKPVLAPFGLWHLSPRSMENINKPCLTSLRQGPPPLTMTPLIFDARWASKSANHLSMRPGRKPGRQNFQTPSGASFWLGFSIRILPRREVTMGVLPNAKKL